MLPVTKAGRAKFGLPVGAITLARSRRQKTQEEAKEEPAVSSEGSEDESSPGVQTEEYKTTPRAELSPTPKILTKT